MTGRPTTHRRARRHRPARAGAKLRNNLRHNTSRALRKLVRRALDRARLAQQDAVIAALRAILQAR
jgi:hypothetical protein